MLRDRCFEGFACVEVEGAEPTESRCAVSTPPTIVSARVALSQDEPPVLGIRVQARPGSVPLDDFIFLILRNGVNEIIELNPDFDPMDIGVRAGLTREIEDPENPDGFLIELIGAVNLEGFQHAQTIELAVADQQFNQSERSILELTPVSIQETGEVCDAFELFDLCSETDYCRLLDEEQDIEGVCVERQVLSLDEPCDPEGVESVCEDGLFCLEVGLVINPEDEEIP
ncbi:MAG: hypothetical protein VYD19_05325, partial [Myxococcota bacterium]|nr:hypothetical protein [Myxococcota bacterium]